MEQETRHFILAVIPALTQPPPDATQYFALICNAILSIIRSPPDPLPDIRNRLFVNDEHLYAGRDVFSLFSVHRVKNEIKNFIPMFEGKVKGFLKWPSVAQWQSMRGVWPRINAAVGAIDGTSHEIYKPTSGQEQFYSGHRGFHAIHTQIIVDNSGIIRHVESGFLGHQNDAQQFRLMTQVGTELPFPQHCSLIGDKIYPNQYPVMTLYSDPQLARKRDAHKDM